MYIQQLSRLILIEVIFETAIETDNQIVISDYSESIDKDIYLEFKEPEGILVHLFYDQTAQKWISFSKFGIESPFKISNEIDPLSNIFWHQLRHTKLLEEDQHFLFSFVLQIEQVRFLTQTETNLILIDVIDLHTSLHCDFRFLAQKYRWNIPQEYEKEDSVSLFKKGRKLLIDKA